MYRHLQGVITASLTRDEPGPFQTRLAKSRHLSPSSLQLFSHTQVFAQSVLLNRSSPGSGSGRANLELVLTLPGQWID